MRSERTAMKRELQPLAESSAHAHELQQQHAFSSSSRALWLNHHSSDVVAAELEHRSSALPRTAATAAAAPLPGIATLFQQQPSHHSHHSHRHHHNHHDAYSRTHVVNSSSNNNSGGSHHAATVASFSHLLATPPTAYAAHATSGHHAHTPNRSARADMMAARGSSPGLEAFKHIGLASSHSDVAVARTHTSYKPKANSSSSSGSALHPQQQHRPARTSRYLREVDRRNILRRIESGEKQADLAKEYQVSRAAISNLKQRRSRKSNNQHSEDDASAAQATGGQELYAHQHQDRSSLEKRSPERVAMVGGSYGGSSRYHHGGGRSSDSDAEPMSSASPSPSSSPVLTASMSPLLHQSHAAPAAAVAVRHEQLELRSLTNAQRDRVVELGAMTTGDVLFARLVDVRTDTRTLQAAVMRLARLLLERAAALFATHAIDVPLPSASLSYVGVATTKPVCAVAVTERAAALLHEFQVIEPQSEIGYVSFAAQLPPSPPSASSSSSSSPASSSYTADGVAVQLPRRVAASSVLVLEPLCSHRSVPELAIAVEAVLRAGAQQEDVCVVALGAHESALAHLLAQFPRVRVVTTKVLPTTAGTNSSSSDHVIEWLHSRLVR